MNLKKLFEKALASEKLVPGTLLFIYLEDCFNFLICEDARGHRWSPSVLSFAQDLLLPLGYNNYDNILRGKISKDKFKYSIVLKIITYPFHLAAYWTTISMPPTMVMEILLLTNDQKQCENRSIAN